GIPPVHRIKARTAEGLTHRGCASQAKRQRESDRPAKSKRGQAIHILWRSALALMHTSTNRLPALLT
ncbi:MAG: hypothetical protein ACOX3I_11380, partial [Limnochordia bacterium]